MDLQVTLVDLPQLLDQVMTTMQSITEPKGNVLRLNNMATQLIEIDAEKLRQCLLNLLSNANKFTEKGEILLTVRQVLGEGDRAVYFEVKDTGIGIKPEQLHQVFNAFTQVDKSTTRRYGGTGLGLTIAQEFVHMMGGKISVTSQYGQGTVFTMCFPDVALSGSAASGSVALSKSVNSGVDTIAPTKITAPAMGGQMRWLLPL